MCVCVCVSRLISTSAGIGSRVTQPRIKAGLRHTTDIYTGVPGLATRHSGGLSHLLVMGEPIDTGPIDRSNDSFGRAATGMTSATF